MTSEMTERRAHEERSPEFINNVDAQYLALLQDILTNGKDSTDRTGTGTKKVFGRMLQFKLTEGFPLLTTKRVWFKGVKEELAWFMRGERNIRPLVQKGVNIWNEWPYQKYLEASGLSTQYRKYSEGWLAGMAKFVEQVKADESFAEQWGDLGPVYGYQWRHWKKRDGGEIDQLGIAIKTLRTNPDDRGTIVSAWNPEDLDQMALRPCHLEYQFGSTLQENGRRTLDCAMLQRSVDTFLGLPFNIASYAAFTEIMAKLTDHDPGNLIMFLGDVHLYQNHIEQAKLQLLREPKQLPVITLNPNLDNIDNISGDDIQIKGYDPHPHIAAPISV
jgi:thymidylate synthase